MRPQANTPVLIGAAQYTWRGGAEGAPTPLGLVTRAPERPPRDEPTLRGVGASARIGRRNLSVPE